MNFKWEGVPSSLIKRIAFVGDQVQTQIAVQFHNGKIWLYPGTKDEYDRFKKAQSHGSYFHNHIKTKIGKAYAP